MRPLSRGPAADDVQSDGTPARGTGALAPPAPGALRYQETAVGRLPVGPAGDAALAAAAAGTTSAPAAGAAPEPPPAEPRGARRAVGRRLGPALAACLAAAVAIVVVRRRTSS